MNDKEITNAELLESMNKGFSNIEKRFSGIETSNQEILELIIRSFSNIENKMVTKDDLANLELNLTTEIQNSRSDFKSFKNDTEHDTKELKNTTEDLDKTSLHYDKRIAKLENKVFA